MSVQAANDTQVRSLVQLAERAGARGERDEARRLLAQARATAPDHPLVLNASGVEELHAGNGDAARQLIERAIGQDDKNVSFWINLATALRRLGKLDDEANALERALALEPRHLLALLQKGSLLELQNRPRAAATVFQQALQTIRPGSQLPEMLRQPLQRAVTAVQQNDAALATFLHDRLQAVRAAQTATQPRFDHCLDALVGKRRIFSPQPTFLHFPKLPAWEFLPREEFPWLEDIEAATAEIRAECAHVLATDAAELVPYIAYPDGVPIDQWAELNHSRRWSAFYLWREGHPVANHIARCPRTAELLARVPKVDAPGHGPTMFFSVLDARTRIPPHTGVTNTRSIVHLPLVVPEGCGFRVGSETREWQPGRAWVFDDTIEHEAWNDSDVPRAILIFDVWNPFLSAGERDLVRGAVQAVREYYSGQSPLSGHI